MIQVRDAHFSCLKLIFLHCDVHRSHNSSTSPSVPRLFLLPAAPTKHGHAPDGSFTDCHGRHAVGHIDDFVALQQQILEGGALLRRIQAAVCSFSASQEFSFRQVRHSTHRLRQLMEVQVTGSFYDLEMKQETRCLLK